MAGRIVTPAFMPALDANGYPLSGALIYVYGNNTTTLAPVYTDATLTTQLSNPVVANSAGVFPSIFAPDGFMASVSVTTSTGAPLATFDSVLTSTVVQNDPAVIQSIISSLIIDGAPSVYGQ